jgi:Uma2 family endonuclease
MSVAEKLLTIEEFAALPDQGRQCELVRGRLVDLDAPQKLHGFIIGEIACRLHSHLRKRPIGRVAVGDSGVVTHRDPDSLRGADVAYYSFERAPVGSTRTNPDGDPPPEIVWKVMSAEDRWADVSEEIADYLAAGVLYVAVVEPEICGVHLYSSGANPRVLRQDDEMTFPGVLPDFRCRVADLFVTCD